MIRNKILNNASWIIAGKIGQSICSFLVTMLTARCLGPTNYGLINYAASLVSFVVPIAQLGLTNIQVQELVEHPEEEGEILGTSMTMSVVASVASLIGVTSFTRILNPGELTTTVVCALYGLMLFFQGSVLLGYWFQARYIYKYASMANLSAYFLMCIYKVYLLLTQKSIYWFAISNALDYLISFVLLVALYKKHSGKRFAFSGAVAKRMWSKSKYYIVVNMMVMVFSQTDKIMLKIMLDDSATGFYAAAMACSNLANFLLVAVIDSFRPMIFEAHHLSKEKFEYNISLLYSIITYLSAAVGLGITVFAPLIIHIIYGSAYDPSISTLRISSWYLIFSYIGVVRNIWILAESCQKYLMPINMMGALSNILLNFLMIPVFGIQGAAIATVATQFVTNIAISFFVPTTRRSVELLLIGLNPRFACRAVRSLLHKK